MQHHDCRHARFECSGGSWLTGLGLLLFFVTAPPMTAQAQDFTVTAPNMTDYSVNGQPDPRLTLVRGVTYTFSLTTPGHPFYIKTVAGNGTANQFTDGVNTNGMTSGTMVFAVPLTAPNVLFYQCSVHSAMGAQIDVVNSTLAPALGPGTALLLALLLLAVTAYATFRNQRVRA